MAVVKDEVRTGRRWYMEILKPRTHLDTFEEP